MFASLPHRIFLVVLTALQGVLMLHSPCAAQDAGTDVAARVREVAARLEVAVRADPACDRRVRDVRLRYVVSRQTEEAANAGIILQRAGSLHLLPSGETACCWDLHAVLPAPDVPATGGYEGTVTIGSRLLTEVCGGQASRLAVLLAHELAHLARWSFSGGDAETDVLRLADLSQATELAADQAGLGYALAAGYEDAVPAAEAAWTAMSEVFGERSPLESAGALSTHPGNRQRLLLLQQDPRRKQLYRSLAAFDTGLAYLQLAEWEPARRCFERAEAAFPRQPEILTDIAYCAMMQFYARLPETARAALGGEVSCLSYATTRPRILGPVPVDRTLLELAVRRYEEALAADPEFLPARIGLGTALVMDPQETAPLQRAVECLTAAAEAAAAGGDACARLDAETNLALALRRQGRLDDNGCRQRLESALAAAPEQPCLALKLNLATALVATQSDWPQARRLLREYLAATPAEGYYHKCAQSLLQRVCTALQRPVASEPAAAADWAGAWSLALPGGGRLDLQDDWEAVQAALGDAPRTVVPLAGLADCLQCDCPSLGLQFRVWQGRLRTVLLTSSAAPPVEVHSYGDPLREGPRLVLQVGRPALRLAAEQSPVVLTPAALGTATHSRVGGREYDFYRGTNLAICWQGSPPQIASLALLSGD